MNILIIGYFIAGAALVAATAFIIRRFIIGKVFQQTLNLKLLSVRLPQTKSETEKKDPLAEINLSAQLFSIIANLKTTAVFEIAVSNIGEDINFYLAVPAAAVEFVSRQIQGFWPNAQIERVGDYTIFMSSGAVNAAYLKQKQTYFFPIRTYKEANLDTLAPIFSNFSKLQAIGEGLAMQIIIRPSPKSAKKAIIKYIGNLKKPAKEGEAPKPESAEQAKLAEQKISLPLFSVNCRLVSAAPNPLRADELLDSLAGSFNQFAAPLRNEFKIIKPKNPGRLISQYIFRQFDAGQSIILNSEELASIFHFPISISETPKIKWVKAKEASPPTNLPSQGTPIGESVFRNETKSVYVEDEDRRRHIYVVGQTGTGKSNLLINMSLADIRQGKGVSIIDPHGDLTDAVLGLIPDNRKNDVVILDPSDLNQPAGLNMLESDPARPEQKTFIVNEMQSIFNKLFLAETMGPMFEQYMRNALMLLMDDPNEQATLIEVPRVFTDTDYRKRLVAKCVNPVVVDFWEKEAVKAGGEASLANMTPYITSKFNNFIANDYIRPIIGQPKSSLNFRQIIDEGKILLVNLSKGRIGDINAGLLGMVVVGKLLMAALSRVDVPQEQRRDFNLYIDEFQNFTTDSIATILSEARKYRLNLVIAHQFIKQLTEKIRDAVFGNVGSMIVFRVGADDAEYLVKQFEPVFDKNDLINIDNFNSYVKLLIRGQTSKPFNIRTTAAASGDPRKREALKESSRRQYGRPRAEIEADILKRLRT
jgi:hypothetical protein